MKIVGIESAAMTASVAVVDDEVIVAEYTVNHKKTHSQTLLPMLDEITRMAELDWAEVEAIAISGGPGSFTGLRIGSATAKGLGLARNLPLISVPTLDAMAYQLYGAEGLICPMLDARRGQVFTGLYRFAPEFEVLMPSCALDAKELGKKLEEYGEEVLLLGDGVPTALPVFEKECRFSFRVVPPMASRARAAAVASLGRVLFREGKSQTAAEHVPEYLRVSQAERVRAEKLAAAGKTL